MGLFSRLRRGAGRTAGGSSTKGQASAHLEQFTRSRLEVEAFIEPATTVTPTTLLLVAKDGEWTRRPVPDPATARSFAKRLGIPAYDVNQSGYPSSMREYNARKKSGGA